MHDDINRRLHEALGRHYHERVGNKGCSCGERFDDYVEQGDHIREANPDYCADPRLVIEAMREKNLISVFIQELTDRWWHLDHRNFGEWLLDLIMDKTGKLALIAIEWLGKQEGRK